MDAEKALDELYATPLEEFVHRRGALARALKAAGDKDAAADVEKRRKPTTTAWILNQLTRRHPDDVAALVDAGRSLARAQRKAMRGEAADLRGAIATQRDVVASVAEKAASMMHELGVDPEAHLADVAHALQAALVDATAGARLEEGRLEKAPETGGGFPGLELEEPAAPAPAPASEAPRETRRRRMIADARDDVADARAVVDAAERGRADAAARVDELEAVALAREQDAVRLADEAERAAGEAHAAREAADAAHDDVAGTERELEAARRALERAEQRVASLEERA